MCDRPRKPDQCQSGSNYRGQASLDQTQQAHAELEDATGATAGHWRGAKLAFGTLLVWHCPLWKAYCQNTRFIGMISMKDDMEGWRNIAIYDIPSREAIADHVVEQLQGTKRTSRQMRDAWRRSRKLAFTQTTGKWNNTPTDKFVNEHAWVLVQLQECGRIRNLGGAANEELYELS